jgi:hypothetical protein
MGHGQPSEPTPFLAGQRHDRVPEEPADVDVYAVAEC